MVYTYIIFCCLLIDFVSAAVYSCDRNATCGCSKTNAILNKIVGGESAINSSWGWAVSLQYYDNQHFCGGAIISPLYIITAAHCVKQKSGIVQDIQVVAGIDVLSYPRPSIAQVRSVVHFISHPEYDSYTKTNDIAILRLNQSLVISNEKGTAQLCLPQFISTDTANSYPVPDSTLVAIGWGLLSSESISIPINHHLQQVTVNAMSADHQMCQYTINSRLQFCAGVINGGKDTCQGDSGGPIMHFESNKSRWVLAGVTSYGTECALPDYAGVYTRVSAYQSWLETILTDNFDEFPTNIITTTSSSGSYYLTDLSINIISPYCSFILLLYIFYNK